MTFDHPITNQLFVPSILAGARGPSPRAASKSKAARASAQRVRCARCRARVMSAGSAAPGGETGGVDVFF